jgi:uncharacterized protein (DUF2252 family)
MHRTGRRYRLPLGLILGALGILVAPPAGAQLRPHPAALADAPDALIERLRADPFTYFRFINRAWISRVCAAFATVPRVPIVRLHGDAHVEQFAVTEDAWGLDDFDDSARGPLFIDVIRFMGSIDLAARERGWTQNRDALWTRFLEGYRRGLLTPGYRPPEPAIVRHIRQQSPATHAEFLAWGERQMQPMDEATKKSVITGMETFERFVRRERPDLRPGFFAVVSAGWLRMGVGSMGINKVLVRVQGPTDDPKDDVFLEGKEVTSLDDFECLEAPTSTAVRIIDGTRQLGRLKHNILAVGPTLLIPGAATRAEHWLEWWVASWEPSYREVHISDLRTVQDLSDIAYDSGVQLGAGEPQDLLVRKQALSAVESLDARFRKETSIIVNDLLAGWKEFRGE